MTDKLPWLGLRSIPGVGIVLGQRLLQRFGGPAAVFKASLQDLAAVKGITPAMAQAIVGFRDWDKLEERLGQLRAQGAELVTQDEPRFPAGLKQIPYPPPLLYIKGTLTPADSLAVAIVGTRGASYYGLKAARRLAGALAALGVTVVSGLARGIDTAAHQGALEMSGRTLAVLGCGLDVVYPPENLKLYQEIPEHGALVSEFPLGTPPEARNFPIRNRIISGLALGVVVIEAGVKAAPASRCATPWTRAGRSLRSPAPSTPPPAPGRTASSRMGPSWSRTSRISSMNSRPCAGLPVPGSPPPPPPAGWRKPRCSAARRPRTRCCRCWARSRCSWRNWSRPPASRSRTSWPASPSWNSRAW